MTEEKSSIPLRGVEPLILSFLNENGRTNQSIRKIGLGIGFSYMVVKKALLHLEELNCVKRVFEQNRSFLGLSIVPVWAITEFGRKTLESY